MTYPLNPGGAALFFSREELAAQALTPERLTECQCLRLIQAALASQGKPIPPALTIELYPARQGILIFVHPKLTTESNPCLFSVTFS